MMPKIFILLLLMLLPCNAEVIEPRGLKSEFSLKCFSIIQPLLQDISVKKQKIDQCDAEILSRDVKLVGTQRKFDELQMKHAILEAVLVEKERQIVDQKELNTLERNNSLIKEETLSSYRVQVQAHEELIKMKTEQIERLQEQAKQNEHQLNATKYRVSELETLQKTQQLEMERNEAQLQNLLTQSNESKEKLSSLQIDLQKKTEEFGKLQEDLHLSDLKVKELKTNLTQSSDQLDKLQKDNQKLVDQVSTCNLQVTTVDAQMSAQMATLQEKQSEIDKLQHNLTSSNAKLASYESEINKIHWTNCISFTNSSEIHRIVAPGIGPIDVLCDSHLAGSGWTVIQRRINGSLDFYRNWTDYRNGFGSLDGEFFIGMEKIHKLTVAQFNELYVHLETFDNQTYYAHYDDFSIDSESEKYALKMLGSYSGTAGDGLLYAKFRMFSTFDADNDHDEINCAELKHGAWWYDRCGLSNLNGQYLKEPSDGSEGIFWYGAQRECFKSVQMMIRPKFALI